MASGVAINQGAKANLMGTAEVGGMRSLATTLELQPNVKGFLRI
jgi:hypothetical protein